MTTVHVELPDELAAEAQAAGLLSGARMEGLLREQLRRQKTDELLEIMHRAAAFDDGTSMTAEDVAEEIHQMRAERRTEAR